MIGFGSNYAQLQCLGVLPSPKVSADSVHVNNHKQNTNWNFWTESAETWGAGSTSEYYKLTEFELATANGLAVSAVWQISSLVGQDASGFYNCC